MTEWKISQQPSLEKTERPYRKFLIVQRPPLRYLLSSIRNTWKSEYGLRVSHGLRAGFSVHFFERGEAAMGSTAVQPESDSESMMKFALGVEGGVHVRNLR